MATHYVIILKACELKSEDMLDLALDDEIGCSLDTTYPDSDEYVHTVVNWDDPCSILIAAGY